MPKSPKKVPYHEIAKIVPDGTALIHYSVTFSTFSRGGKWVNSYAIAGDQIDKVVTDECLQEIIDALEHYVKYLKNAEPGESWNFEE